MASDLKPMNQAGKKEHPAASTTEMMVEFRRGLIEGGFPEDAATEMARE